MIFNKLVRDKIPELIAKQGKKVTFRALQGDELKKALKDKLLEEVQELVNAETFEQIVEEMADVHEVLNAMQVALMDAIIPSPTIERILNEKRDTRGGFRNGYFLESVEGE